MPELENRTRGLHRGSVALNLTNRHMMDMKYNLITKYPDETKFLNMVSKETHKEVSKDIRNILSIYHKKSKRKFQVEVSHLLKFTRYLIFRLSSTCLIMS